MNGTKLFKKIVRPFYNLLSQKLVDDLRVQEIQDMLLQINHRAFTIEEELKRLKSIQAATNIILSGTDTFENALYQKYKEAPLEIFDLVAAIGEGIIPATDVMPYFDKLAIPLTNKTVTIIGGGNNLFTHIAKRRGAKKVIRIESSSKLSPKKEVGEVHFIYPLDLLKTKFDHTDILIIPNPSWSSLLISRNLAGIGAYVKEAIIISTRVRQNTAFNSDVEPAIFENSGRISFNDNYVRQQLHQNGFVEVRGIYTEGTEIDNKFDMKVSKFNHLKGLTIVTRNNKHKADKKYNNNDSVEKIYIGYKLPQNK